GAPGRDHAARGRGPELRGDRQADGLPGRDGALAHLPRPRGDRPGTQAVDGRRNQRGACHQMTHHEDSDSIQSVPDPDKLDRYHRQQLSAMLDGELSPDQARFMLRRLQHDADLAGCWERWQVCGDVLRGQRNALLPADFSQKIAVAIAADGAPPSQARAHSGGPRLLRWGGGAALAASVAMAALLVGRQAGLEPDQASPPLLQLAASSVPARPAPTPATTDPAPERAPATDTAAMLAGTALAAAEAPRRAAERRERVQERG